MYKFEFELQAADVNNILAAVLGKRHQLLVRLAFASGAFLILMSLYSAIIGQSWLITFVAGVIGCSTTFASRPFFRQIGQEVRVQIDQNCLFSSCGETSSTIPFTYFERHGKAVELDDHFHLTSRLGRLYIPKRVFQDDEHMSQFRNYIRQFLGNRFEREIVSTEKIAG